ncbi:MAG: DUF5610 domain-containing protein [Zoogloeaceae bacterium]|jgi:hypothetical protein|nr:DUF5610 domain-containing protein [Zoogloeaceae bacterium]
MSVSFTNPSPAVATHYNKTGYGAGDRQNSVQQGADASANVNDAQKPTTAAGISRALQHETNKQILQASAEVSIQAGNKSQALLYRSAIERINEILAPELGPDAIQSAVKSGVDASPEATAERILAFSTAFFDSYAKQNPGKDPDQLATDFVALIRGGFEKGFNEAKDILNSLGVLKGDIADGIQRTFDLVQKGYDDFLASKLSS